jgi:spermidine synthase
MLEARTIATACVADGSEFTLVRQDQEWVVRVGGRVLMSSRMHDSEEALAEHALERVDEPEAVLVGGLGLGFTLRAVLDRVADDVAVTVAELVPELVEWNRVHLTELHDHALDDPRCEVVVGDVLETLKRSSGAFDVILLDVDNGPVALSQEGNQRLYSEHGVRACYAALAPYGVLAVWSAGPSPPFERRLAAAGFEVEVLRVAARHGSRARHVLFLAARGAGPALARGARPAKARRNADGAGKKRSGR